MLNVHPGSWNEIRLGQIGLVLCAASAKEFARNSWDRLKKQGNLAQVENSKVSCTETALKRTVGKPWGRHSHCLVAILTLCGFHRRRPG